MRQMLALLAAALLLTACAAPPERSPAAEAEERPTERQFLSMDTVMSLCVYGGEDAVPAAEAELQRLEALLSRTEPDSGVSRLNRSAGRTAEAGEELWMLLTAAEGYTAATGGAFDVTVAPVVAAWGFTEATQQVPAPALLAELLEHVGPEHVHLEADGVSVRLDAGTEIDLGGIAKGYAADRLWAIFQEAGSPRGWASLGGNVLAWGTRPDGTPWRVGIQDPRYPDQQRFVGTLGLEDAFAVTSGGYQRYFEQNGVTYHHILDPASGMPAGSGLVSVTVVAAAQGDAAARTPGSGAMCDAFSTALFVMGEEKALEFWRSGGYEFQLVLVTEDGRVVSTAGLEGIFTPEDGSGYVYETVS